MAEHFLQCALQLLAVLCVFGKAEATCPPTSSGDPQSVTTYQAINPTQYDRNYSRIDSGRHPLGFYSGTWFYNQNKANPCIKITAPNAGKRWIDIKVETIPESRVCFKDQESTNVCFQGRGTVCRATPADDTYIEVLCDDRCEEADVNFWYRLVLSPLPTEVDPETWCFNQQNEYPTDLLTLPQGQTLPTRTTPRPKDTGTASTQSASMSVLVTAMLLLAVCL
ncbi:hypothetical protein V1264_021084 [Littorina saxatilis]|uniref:Uncharacterized protein n=2 Tax=Littorina saxatilis TaxID=31220 RepID=A0AAN9GC62_9CAEN